MMRESLGAALILAASVAAVSGGQPTARHDTAPPSRPIASAVRPDPTVAQQFQFHDLIFTIPASWSVERADQQRLRMQYATVTGKPTGPRLTFSDSVELVSHAGWPRDRPDIVRRGQRLSFERLEMPNPMVRGIVYVFREAGITISAQVRSAGEARAADAVAESARWVVPNPPPGRS
jgi:hypothetical protein